MANPIVVIMAKPPLLGEVKTRLAADVGDEMALHVYTQLLQHTLDEVKNSGLDVLLCPTSSHDFFKSWEFDQVLQVRGELGLKMEHAAQAAFAKSSPLIMIGTDCPDLTSATLLEAAQKLDHHEVVFGPSEDGGYYLLGMRQMRTTLFRDLPWSTPQVLELSRQKCIENQLTFAELQTYNDIDNMQDLKESSIWNKVKDFA